MNAHSRHAGSPGGHRSLWILSLVVVILAVAAVGTTLALRTSGPSQAAGGTGTTTSTSGAPAKVAKTLSVVSTTPTSGAANVPTDIAITVQLSAPLAAGSAMPTLSPAVAGTWKKVGKATLAFAATAPLIPSTSETLTVPGGSTGVRDQAGSTLAAPLVVPFTVAQGSTERLQQLLAQLNYLPLSFAPTGPAHLAGAKRPDPQAGVVHLAVGQPPASLMACGSEGRRTSSPRER